jgi:hypothetical protein
LCLRLQREYLLARRQHLSMRSMHLV